MDIELKNRSQSSYRQQSIADVDDQQLPLRNIPNQSSSIKCPRRQKVFKAIILIIIVIIPLGMISTFLSDDFIKSRRPKSLSPNSQIIELVAPEETDYRSYYYYKIILEKALNNIKEGKNQDIKKQFEPFKNMTFSQTYNIFKVIKTIQLAKDYSTSHEQQQQIYHPPQQLNLKKAVNYSEFFPPAVDQFKCASCYVFPVVATIQYLYKIKKNIDIKLSQQQLIDCNKQDPKQNGCEDGNLTRVFQYARDIGVTQSQIYPYKSLSGASFPCRNQTIQKKQIKKYKISGFKKLPYRNCQAIQQQLVRGNVVASMINVGSLSSYSGGTFKDCRRTGKNHAITIVGQTQKNEWIVRNSWGINWGNKGYFILGRGNTCGVCDFSYVPILEFDQNGEVKKILDPIEDNQKGQQ